MSKVTQLLSRLTGINTWVSPIPTLVLFILNKIDRSSCCGVTGPAVSLQHQDAGSIPGPDAQRSGLEDPALPQLWLRSDPGSGNSICCVATKKQKTKTNKQTNKKIYLYTKQTEKPNKPPSPREYYKKMN